jgi:hypothetical protein
MTQQALPPSVDQQLADARTASAQAQGRIAELEAIVVKERARADRAEARAAELRAEIAELRRAVWIPQDDDGTRYCALCEQRYPDHYHSCAFDAALAAGEGEGT